MYIFSVNANDYKVYRRINIEGIEFYHSSVFKKSSK